MMVIRVDENKRYIGLSKKKVQATEAVTAEKRFKKANIVHKILKQVAKKLNSTLLELYENFGWHLYDKYGHAFDAFRLLMNDPGQVFKDIIITE
jgi:translation initiation factor 2 subunit 1